MTPNRIRLSRAKGWRKPEGAISCGRPGPYRNPFRIGGVFVLGDPGVRGGLQMAYLEALSEEAKRDPRYTLIESAAQAVDWFRRYSQAWNPSYLAKVRRDLAGHDLGCWCRLCPAHADGKPMGVECPDCAPCHVDPLIVLANATEDGSQDRVQEQAEPSTRSGAGTEPKSPRLSRGWRP